LARSTGRRVLPKLVGKTPERLGEDFSFAIYHISVSYAVE
jgi:hypothetical protein